MNMFKKIALIKCLTLLAFQFVNAQQVLSFQIPDCEITSVQDSYDFNTEINLYPNPADDILTINWGANFNEVNKIYVYNLKGALVISKSINSNIDRTFHLDVKELETGLYYLILMTDKDSFGKTFLVN